MNRFNNICLDIILAVCLIGMTFMAAKKIYELIIFIGDLKWTIM